MSAIYSRAALAMDAAQMAEKNFSTNFAAFAPQAWARFDASSQDVTSWARAEAATFKRTISPQIEFLRPFYALSTFANVQQGLEQQRAASENWTESVKAVKHSSPSSSWTDAMTEAREEILQKKLQKYAPVAWTRYNPSELPTHGVGSNSGRRSVGVAASNTDIANWARTEARTFYHLCDGAYPFVTAWQFLCAYAESRENESPQVRRDQVAQQAARDFQDASLTTVFANNGEQTEAERRAGRAELNRVLFREYTAWWDAFETEAVEDMDVDAPTASQRFAQHCSKILQRRTGLRTNLIEPIVEAWLLDKANA